MPPLRPQPTSKTRRSRTTSRRSPERIRAGQPARTFSFCTWNSASVRTPESRSSPSSLSVVSLSGCGSAGGASWAPPSCGCSSPAQRFACRRDTRVETAVAVPAPTAVRAIAGRSGIVFLPSREWLDGRCLELVERFEDCVDRDPAVRDDLCAAAPDRRDERSRPAVLVQQDRGLRAGLDRGTRFVVVVLAEQPGRGAVELDEVERTVGVDVGDREAGDGAVLALLDEDEVEHADDSAVGEADDLVEPFARGLLARRPLDDQVVDGADLEVVVAHSCLLCVAERLVPGGASRTTEAAASSNLGDCRAPAGSETSADGDESGFHRGGVARARARARGGGLPGGAQRPGLLRQLQGGQRARETPEPGAPEERQRDHPGA